LSRPAGLPPAALAYESPLVPIAQRLKQDTGWQVVTVPYGHDAMVDAPKELAELLIAASL
jgi:hypothetical protein